MKYLRASLVAQMVNYLPAMQETQVWSLDLEDPLEKGMTTYSSILAWRIPWTEEPGGLQSMGFQRVEDDWATNTHRDHLACQKSLSPNLCFSAKCFTVPFYTSCFKAVQKEKGSQMVISFWSLVWSLNELPHCQEGLSGWYLDLSWIFQILWMVSEMTQLPTSFGSYWAHSVDQALLGVRSTNVDHADSVVAHSYMQFLCCFQPWTIIFCKQESFVLRSSSFMISPFSNLNNVVLFIFF